MVDGNWDMQRFVPKRCRVTAWGVRGTGIDTHYGVRPRVNRVPSRAAMGGYSLVEALVVLTIMGILISLAAPSFLRTMEQSRADLAAANLRAIWSAERLYWLEYRTYADDLAVLQSLGLLDTAVVASTTPYQYAITSASNAAFTATAMRTGSTRWSGQFTIDEAGVVSGAIEAAGQNDILPGFQ